MTAVRASTPSPTATRGVESTRRTDRTGTALASPEVD